MNKSLESTLNYNVKGMNIILLALLLLISCGKEKTHGDLFARGQVGDNSSTPDNAPVTTSSDLGDKDAGEEFIVTLTYTDADGDAAQSCAVSNLVDLTITTACSCTSGSCSVGLTSSVNHLGAVSFDYTVTSNVTTSNSSTMSANILSPFTSVWRTTVDNETITLPLNSNVYVSYNATVYWGDGSSSEITSWDDPDTTHTYATAGEYTVKIYGIFESIKFNNTGDKSKLLKVLNLGNTNWKNLNSAFRGCLNMTVFRAGHVENVKDMRYTFAGANSVNPEIGHWKTSEVRFSNNMFQGALLANPDVSNWDMSKNTNIREMFINAASANPDVSLWNTSSCQYFSRIFSGASSADPDVSNWDFSNTISIVGIFGSSNISIENYSNALVQIELTSTAVNLDLGTIPSQYNSSASAARAALLADGWTITDDGLAP